MQLAEGLRLGSPHRFTSDRASPGQSTEPVDGRDEEQCLNESPAVGGIEPGVAYFTR